FNEAGRGSVCSRAIMLVTDGATKMYDEVFEKYNWPERKVCVPNHQHIDTPFYPEKPPGD
ncbi:voltage-dependent calcium channel subunit alpha-2/delta-3 isoform X1, partial [Tachysurus ichikawai]